MFATLPAKKKVEPKSYLLLRLNIRSSLLIIKSQRVNQYRNYTKTKTKSQGEKNEEIE